MQIEFHQIDASGTHGVLMYQGDKLIRNYKYPNGRGDFSDEEVEALIGPAHFRLFQAGQTKFDVPQWKLDFVQKGKFSLETPQRSQENWIYTFSVM